MSFQQSPSHSRFNTTHFILLLEAVQLDKQLVERHFDKLLVLGLGTVSVD